MGLSWSSWNLEMLVLWKDENWSGEPGQENLEKNPQSNETTINNSTQPAGIQPSKSHWWETTDLTIAPTLLS